MDVRQKSPDEMQQWTELPLADNTEKLATVDCLRSVLRMRLGKAAVSLTAVAAFIGIPVASGGGEVASSPVVQAAEPALPSSHVLEDKRERISPSKQVQQQPTSASAKNKAAIVPPHQTEQQSSGTQNTVAANSDRSSSSAPANESGKTGPLQLVSGLLAGVKDLADGLVGLGAQLSSPPLSTAEIGRIGASPAASFEGIRAFQGTGAEAMVKIKSIHADVPELKLFMAAIQYRESTGQSAAVGPPVPGRSDRAYGYYQIMQKIWPSWSNEVFGELREQTPDNQQIVASFKMRQYWLEFKSWDMVAVSWFAGPPRARQLLAGDQRVWNLSDGYTTVRQYVSNMQSSMNTIRSQSK